jgi:hypothetical protein
MQVWGVGKSGRLLSKVSDKFLEYINRQFRQATYASTSNGQKAPTRKALNHKNIWFDEATATTSR